MTLAPIQTEKPKRQRDDTKTSQKTRPHKDRGPTQGGQLGQRQPPNRRGQTVPRDPNPPPIEKAMQSKGHTLKKPQTILPTKTKSQPKRRGHQNNHTNTLGDKKSTSKIHKDICQSDHARPSGSEPRSKDQRNPD